MNKPFHVNSVEERKEYIRLKKLSIEELKELAIDKNNKYHEMIVYIIKRKEEK